jgi:glutamate N-acetyltransferase/amino-acid N-acetyltransferase
VTALPSGFTAVVANVGIKDASDDTTLLVADRPATAAAVFTRSRFAGPSVVLSRDHVGDGQARAVIVLSKNANVANGPDGIADAAEVVGLVADGLGCGASEVLIASTGVIGRRYPMERIRSGLPLVLAARRTAELEDLARGIMTTDTVPKTSSAMIGDGPAIVAGVAKGVGMIEPDMATMIAVIMTDADVGRDRLEAVFRSVVDRTFNCVSVDGDTSTSDSAFILASGAAGEVDDAAFERALSTVCTSLARQIAADGEGAETLIEVLVDGASSPAQARRVAKSIVNSPLVKTAVHGADPNWGRVAMAIGKCADDTDIDPESVVIRFGSTETYPTRLDESGLANLSAYLRGDEVVIHVSLGAGTHSATVWGCDLTEGYIRINADYTT